MSNPMADQQSEITPERFRELQDQVIQFSDELAGMSLRLNVAEQVCLMYGWTAAPDDSDRAKAAYVLWRAWADLVGSEFAGPEAHPEMTDEWITSLARERDDLRARTLECMGLPVAGSVREDGAGDG